MLQAIALIVLVALAPSQASTGAPRGWRYPTPSEVAQPWRDASPHRYLIVTADLDADGRPDRAELLVATEGGGAAVVVTLARAPEQPLIVERLTDAAKLAAMGIDLVQPGRYETACGKGYWKCADGEPALLVLERPAINLFAVEGANSFVFFDPSTRAFRGVWISD